MPLWPERDRRQAERLLPMLLCWCNVLKRCIETQIKLWVHYGFIFIIKKITTFLSWSYLFYFVAFICLSVLKKKVCGIINYLRSCWRSWLLWAEKISYSVLCCSRTDEALSGLWQDPCKTTVGFWEIRLTSLSLELSGFLQQFHRFSERSLNDQKKSH